MDSPRRSKRPPAIPGTCRLGDWYTKVSRIAQLAVCRSVPKDKTPEECAWFITEADLGLVTGVLCLVGGVDDPDAQALCEALRDLFFMPQRMRGTRKNLRCLTTPFSREAALRVVACWRAYRTLIQNSGRGSSFRSKCRPGDVLRHMARIEDAEGYLQWVVRTMTGRLSPRRVFSTLYDRYRESSDYLERQRMSMASDADAMYRSFAELAT